MSCIDFDLGSDANDGSWEYPFASVKHAIGVYNDPDFIEWIIVFPKATPHEMVHGRKYEVPKDE